MLNPDTVLPWTHLTLEQARAKLTAWHLMKEQLADTESYHYRNRPEGEIDEQ